jgi:hypothetical protein
MANSTANLFETLVAAASEASTALKFRNSFLETIYMGFEPNYATLGQTLNINIPVVNEGNVQDIQAGDIQIADYAYTTASITFNRNMQTAFVVRNFDEVRTPEQLRQKFLDAYLEALLRKVDRDVCSLVTATNFNVYSTITGGTKVFTRTQLTTAWNNLAGGGVPIDDTANLFFMTSNLPFSNMLNDSSFNQESIVGIDAADKTRTAAFLPQFGATLTWDQLFPQPTANTTYAGLFYHRYAIAMRTAPLPPMADGSLKETYVYPKPNLPVRIQMQNSMQHQGTVVSLNCAYGVNVVRPTHGSYLVTT